MYFAGKSCMVCGRFGTWNPRVWDLHWNAVHRGVMWRVMHTENRCVNIFLRSCLATLEITFGCLYGILCWINIMFFLKKRNAYPIPAYDSAGALFLHLFDSKRSRLPQWNHDCPSGSITVICHEVQWLRQGKLANYFLVVSFVSQTASPIPSVALEYLKHWTVKYGRAHWQPLKDH